MDLPRAKNIQTAVLQSDVAQVRILSLGCITQDWMIDTAQGSRRMVLGYADLADYLTTPHYMGMIVGRVANRIGQGRFDLDGKTYQLTCNDPPHTLHGGTIGLGKRNWQMHQDGQRAVQLKYLSRDGEEGFPGAVAFEVIIVLDHDRLSYEMRARPDRPTPINMAQHSYYTLGQTRADALTLHLPSEMLTANDATLLPTGELASVANTRLDFRTGTRIRDADPLGSGIDQNFILNGRVVRVVAPDGIELEMHTDQPGLQVYTAAHLGPHGTPLPGQLHHPFGALCLEPQNFPDAVNKAHFPDSVYTPECPYAQSLSIRIGAGT